MNPNERMTTMPGSTKYGSGVIKLRDALRKLFRSHQYEMHLAPKLRILSSQTVAVGKRYKVCVTNHDNVSDDKPLVEVYYTTSKKLSNGVVNTDTLVTPLCTLEAFFHTFCSHYKLMCGIMFIQDNILHYPESVLARLIHDDVISSAMLHGLSTAIFKKAGCDHAKRKNRILRSYLKSRNIEL